MNGIPTGGGFWASVTVCYIVGAVPFGYITARLRGIDIRKVGSGNIGATNVARALGKKWGYLVLALDIAKGRFASALVPLLVVKLGILGKEAALPLAALGGIAAILGHIYPVYLLLRGGKGVATTLGVFTGLLHYWILIPLAAYLLTAKVTDYVSAGSLAAAAVLPVTAWAVYRGDDGGPWAWGGALVVSLFVIWQHRGNIKRIWNGTESRRSALKQRPPAGSGDG